jgi:SAM-dependent methyltransferase
MEYYTHNSPNSMHMSSFIAGASFKTRLKVGYYNVAYGYRLPTAIWIGYLVACASARKKVEWDHFIRHLPAPDDPYASLLDIGCGAGDFLHVAKQLGYRPLGYDPDPSAVEFANRMGLAAKVGGLPNTGLDDDAFDQICLNHVLEHVHEPILALAELFRILKPGGRIWLTQPNIDAVGLAVFGKSWRGLETPRHLVLMNPDGLKNIFTQAGFVDVELLRPRPEALGSFRASLCMSEGTLPAEDASPSGWDNGWRKKAHKADKLSATNPAVAENLTLVAWKRRGSRAS